jgi:hypothetical protein
MQRRIASLRNIQRYLDNLEPETEVKVAAESERPSPSHKTQSQATLAPTLSADKFSTVVAELKQQKLNKKTKDILQRFFEKHNKATKNLKEQKLFKMYELEDKRELERKKMVAIKQNKLSFLQKMASAPRGKPKPVTETSPRSSENSERSNTPPPKIDTKSYFVPNKHDYGAWK